MCWVGMAVSLLQVEMSVVMVTAETLGMMLGVLNGLIYVMEAGVATVALHEAQAAIEVGSLAARILPNVIAVLTVLTSMAMLCARPGPAWSCTALHCHVLLCMSLQGPTWADCVPCGPSCPPPGPAWRRGAQG